MDVDWDYELSYPTRAFHFFIMGSIEWHALVLVGMLNCRETWLRQSTSEAMTHKIT
jgi:hypothetical protein